ncbi:Rid family detoxifying hydrolase [Psychroserpens sp.]|uniref:RidA family protein n=1 Tax=Psychroserpens sp. TaxID=2020870 RepID=UPI001B0495AB|nr:Rid family detoxifying hydrolase [Psychroserpens sp.]MBO6608033.1 RidA family protein [Psychroserpens sp.]MBO6655143.1 RidA family protein [Psychroserpens sp.]MBO6683243.1 RidA family protein [Psychroserpens sp.]MBO6751406.1 RidA family protein [Psychroserpens sp.]MBO6916732.1 RidA family protein [Psychroserpens sp.]
MKKTQVIFLLFFVIISSCREQKTDSLIYYESHEPKKINAPFSDAVEANGFLFLAGQVGMDQGTRTLVQGGIKAETKQCIENIKAVLEQHGSSLDRVVKCTVILKQIEDFAAFNEVYKTYFPNKPARTTFAASGLAVGAQIEIDVIALK